MKYVHNWITLDSENAEILNLPNGLLYEHDCGNTIFVPDINYNNGFILISDLKLKNLKIQEEKESPLKKDE